MSKETTTQIIPLIYKAIDEVNTNSPSDTCLKKTPETILSLTSDKGGLDSLGSILFVISLEKIIEEETGVSVELAYDLNISKDHNPFETVEVLAGDISVLLEKKGVV